MTEEKTETRRWYFPDGKISKETNLINGIPHGITKGYQEHNGALAYEINYNKGWQEGVSRYFYSDVKHEQISVETFYVKNRMQGCSSMWFRNGKIAIKSYYENGIHDGEQIYFEY